jgi:hypothetical protein
MGATMKKTVADMALQSGSSKCVFYCGIIDIVHPGFSKLNRSLRVQIYKHYFETVDEVDLHAFQRAGYNTINAVIKIHGLDVNLLETCPSIKEEASQV